MNGAREASPSPRTESSSTPVQASLIIDFLVIGGGLTGLIAAYALARSGHRITVVEQGNFDELKNDEVCWTPPNISRTLFRWGLEERIRQIAMTSTSAHFNRYEYNEYLGKREWTDECLNDAGGDFIFTRLSDLWRLVYQIALEAGVRIRPNAEVTSIDTNERCVILSSGEKISSHVIIGADGLNGISRSTLLDGKSDNSTPTGVVLYNTWVCAEDDPELAEISDSSSVFIFLGDNRAARVVPLREIRGIALSLYLPDQGIESEPTLAELREAVGPLQERLRKCMERATGITRAPIEERPDLKDWVHDTCPLLLIGNAAQPMPPGSIHSPSVAMEDAAALGRLFSHLRNEGQIRSFLYAFHDIRQPRRSMLLEHESRLIHLSTLPNGERKAAREAMMKFNAARGLDVMGSHDEASEFENRYLATFLYDAEDEADDWWIKWGALRERARELALES